jgi:DNA primase
MTAICDAAEGSGESVIHRKDGEVMMKCPFHADDTPSLAVNVMKNGCWTCFGCKRKGNIFALLAQLGETSIGEAIQSLAARKGIDVEYQDPDHSATIYEYKTEDGKKVLKQVLRRLKDGKKIFTQRRPGAGGYICNVDGVPPSLYHIELLQWATTVCITEGEKDADTVTNLELSQWPKQVIGVTSGSSDSWRPEFAKHLIGKDVVLMPDADEAGERFAEAVGASLDAEDIKYRVVSFADVGCKDVSHFLETHSVRELVQRIGHDLIALPTGQWKIWPPVAAQAISTVTSAAPTAP